MIFLGGLEKFFFETDGDDERERLYIFIISWI